MSVSMSVSLSDSAPTTSLAITAFLSSLSDANLVNSHSYPSHSFATNMVNFHRFSITRSGDLSSHTPVPDVPHSKRSILRFFSTKFSFRRPISKTNAPSLPRVPAPKSAFGTKEQRDAALRERGLLPPLNPEKDLSQQEREQDKLLPVAIPSPTIVQQLDAVADVEAHLTAASLIKKEWEAKNQSQDSVDRARMTTFKFGASPLDSSTPPPEKPMVESKLQHLAAAQELYPDAIRSFSPGSFSPSNPITAVQGDRGPSPQPSDTHLSVPSSPNLSPTPIDLSGSSLNPASIPLPSSPSPHSLRDESAAIPAGVASPVGNDSANLQLPRTPTISLTPPSALVDHAPNTPCLDHDDLAHDIEDPAAAQAQRARSNSYMTQISVAESMSSIATPSLGGSSQTMTISTLESMQSTNLSTNSGGKGKVGGLRVKTYFNQTQSAVIVESPIESSFTGDSNDAFETNDIRSGTDHLGSIAEEEISSSSPSHLSPLRLPASAGSSTIIPPEFEPLKRGVSDTQYVYVSKRTRKQERKRLMMEHARRAQTDDPSQREDANPHDSTKAPKRLTVSSSLSSMRRNVIGTLSRTRSTFDIPKDQPSPLLAPRRAVSPMLHSRGSILMEANNIEDEETRRRTELAFLG